MMLKVLDEQVSHLLSLELTHREASSLELRQCTVNIIDLRKSAVEVHTTPLIPLNDLHTPCVQ